MSKLLVQYSKLGPIAYISHLEFMRSFERALRRAGVEVAISAGFNPRPKIAYGSALSVGMNSYAEYLILDLRVEKREDDFLRDVQAVLPQGLKLQKAKYVDSSVKSIMSLVQSCAYRVRVTLHPDDAENLAQSINQLLSEKQLLVRHKDNEKWVETKSTIQGFDISEKDRNEITLKLITAVYQDGSIKPVALVEKLADYIEYPNEFSVIGIERLEQYINRVSPFINIYDFYEGVTMGSERN